MNLYLITRNKQFSFFLNTCIVDFKIFKSEFSIFPFRFDSIIKVRANFIRGDRDNLSKQTSQLTLELHEFYTAD